MTKTRLFITMIGISVTGLCVTGCSNSMAAPSQEKKQELVTTRSLAPEGIIQHSSIIRPSSTPRSSLSPTNSESLAMQDKPTKEEMKFVKQELKQELKAANKSMSDQQTPPKDEKEKPAESKPATSESKPEEKKEAAPVSTSPPPTASTEMSKANSSGTKNPWSYSYTISKNENARGNFYTKQNLPAGLPDWFAERDKDGDGQVALSEWPDDGLSEFRKIDTNGDGIITMQEAMRSVGKSLNTVTTGSVTVGTPASSSSSTPPAATTSSSSSTTASNTSQPSLGGGNGFFGGRGGDRGNRGGGREMGFGGGGGGRENGFSGGSPGRGDRGMNGGGGSFGGNNFGSSMNMSEEDRNKRSVEMTMQFTDSNKDGALDENEIKNSRTLSSIDWKKYDKNSDKKLDKEELLAAYKTEGDKLRRGGGGFGGGGPGGFGSDPAQQSKVMFDNLDKGKTGKIAQKDFPSFMTNRLPFDQWDTNKDGSVDLAEFQKGYEKWRGTMGRR